MSEYIAGPFVCRLPGCHDPVQHRHSTESLMDLVVMLTKQEERLRADLASLRAERVKMESVVQNWREMGLSLWAQFAAYDESAVKGDATTKYSNMALGALEDLEHALESLGLIDKNGVPQWDALASHSKTEGGA